MERASIVLGAVAAIVAVAACADRQPTGTDVPRRPNVVLITIDALRADALGHAGGPSGVSPNLDRLAGESTVFETAISPFCATPPSMASLMTGRHPSFEGVEAWDPTTWYGFPSEQVEGVRTAGSLTDDVVMLAEIAAAHGYRTVGFHTNPHLSRQSNFDQGFQEYHEFADYLARVRQNRPHRMIGHYPPAAEVADATTAWLGGATDGPQPLFLWVHLMDTHSPYLPPDPHRDRFVPAGTRTVDDLLANDALYHLLFVGQEARKKAAAYPTPDELGMPLPDLTAHWHGLYHGEAALADEQIGRIREGLERAGLWDTSLVVVTSDHGEEFLEHGHVAHNRRSAMAEVLIHVPLIVKTPADDAGSAARHVADLVRLVDVAPTILDYAGIGSEGIPMDGRTLRPLLEGRGEEPRTAFISGVWWGVARTADWKYRLEKPSWTRGDEQHRLYAISSDPREAVDVAGQHPEILHDLRTRYSEFAARLARRSADAATPPGAAASIDDDRRRALEALGYVTGSE